MECEGRRGSLFWTESKPLLIIPEQFSFDTEKSMLKFLGAEKLKKFDIVDSTAIKFGHLLGHLDVRDSLAVLIVG